MLGGVLRAGFVVNFLSQPVLSGYVTGAALVIAASQLGKVLGYSVSGDTFFQIVRDALRNINQTNLWTLGVACASVVVMVALQRLTPKLPAALIVVILAVVVTTVFDLAAEGVKITGVVPGGLPSFKFPNVGLNDIGRLLNDAAGLALVAYVESIAVSKAVAARRGYPIDANRELIAVGAANVGSGLFQGFTIDGSFSRTAMADGGRATTQLAGLTTAVVVGITLLFLTPLFKNLPAATLGAVVIVAVSGLLDTAGLRRAWRIRREDFVMGLVALIGVLTFGVLEGLLIAVGTSLIALLYHAASPHRAVLGYMPDDDSFHDVEQRILCRSRSGLLSCVRPSEDDGTARLYGGRLQPRPSPILPGQAQSGKRRIPLARFESTHPPIEASGCDMG
jgi:SulP family sulfate permease